jgi:hypothetical protein
MDATADVGIYWIYSGGADRYHYFAAAWLQLGYVFQSHFLWAAKLSYSNRSQIDLLISAP